MADLSPLDEPDDFDVRREVDDRTLEGGFGTDAARIDQDSVTDSCPAA